MPADPGASQALIDHLRSQFARAANPERAVGQQAYMKSAMPYLGLTMPELRSICVELFREIQLESTASWEATACQLWRQAEYREERYAALELVGFKAYRRFFNPALIGTLEEFIVTGAWWDYVDNIAVNFVGHLLANHGDDIQPILERWSVDTDVWRRRTAILSQLKFKELTSQTLLFRWIEPSLEEKEFFLRKAIGWALREYSKTNPQAVIDYVASNESRLSGLSRREALKVLKKKGLVRQEAMGTNARRAGCSVRLRIRGSTR